MSEAISLTVSKLLGDSELSPRVRANRAAKLIRELQRLQRWETDPDRLALIPPMIEKLEKVTLAI